MVTLLFCFILLHSFCRLFVASSLSSGHPTYPTSTRSGANRDWDKLVADIKQEEKDEKLDGEAGLNKFFRELYGNASEETKRAMNKSFVS